jgi:hypothetical protein
VCAALAAVLGCALPASAAADPVIMAAGDISCASQVQKAETCHQAGTADLLRQQRDSPEGLAAVMPLGDNQYSSGTLTSYLTYFATTWGQVADRIFPVPGNHEYNTKAAQGYYDYFNGVGQRTGRAGERDKGYYSYDIGDWHLVALNSNCAFVDGCAAGSPQAAWLSADLAAHPAACILAYWHHPRFNSGHHGDAVEMTGFWQALAKAGADIVLSGHDHLYERFAPQTASGGADPTHGIRQFTVGTGGHSHDAFTSLKPNSEVRMNDTFGVLKVTLHRGSYAWAFVPEAGGSFTDTGSQPCHHAGTGVAPSAPPGHSVVPGPGVTPAPSQRPSTSVPGVPRLALRAPKRQPLRSARRVRALAWTDAPATATFSGVVVAGGRRIGLRPQAVRLTPGGARRLERTLPRAAVAAVRLAARQHRRAIARLALRAERSTTRAVVTIDLLP